jgi:hypothetical protein
MVPLDWNVEVRLQIQFRACILPLAASAWLNELSKAASRLRPYESARNFQSAIQNIGRQSNSSEAALPMTCNSSREPIWWERWNKWRWSWSNVLFWLVKVVLESRHRLDSGSRVQRHYKLFCWYVVIGWWVTRIALSQEQEEEWKKRHHANRWTMRLAMIGPIKLNTRARIKYARKNLDQV